jgi:hypothetical protein
VIITSIPGATEFTTATANAEEIADRNKDYKNISINKMYFSYPRVMATEISVL